MFAASNRFFSALPGLARAGGLRAGRLEVCVPACLLPCLIPCRVRPALTQNVRM